MRCDTTKYHDMTMNRHRRLLTFIFTLTLSIAFGQTGVIKPSFVDDVKSIVLDSSSTYFYPKLLDKIKSHPDAISKEDLYFLYYGQLCQPGHMRLSFMANPESGEFQKFVEQGKCKKAIPIGLAILNRSPVDLTTLLYVNDCLKETGQADTEFFLDRRFRLLLDAIFSTGDGLTKETAIKITNSEDDFVLKGIMKFLGGTESIETGDNKAYSVWQKGKKSLYFEDIWAY